MPTATVRSNTASSVPGGRSTREVDFGDDPRPSVRNSGLKTPSRLGYGIRLRGEVGGAGSCYRSSVMFFALRRYTLMCVSALTLALSCGRITGDSMLGSDGDAPVNTGGSENGPGTGGAQAATGGEAPDVMIPTGGSPSGGAATGGTSTATGGTSSGGASSGGAPSGGTSPGGAGLGGDGGAPRGLHHR